MGHALRLLIDEPDDGEDLDPAVEHDVHEKAEDDDVRQAGAVHVQLVPDRDEHAEKIIVIYCTLSTNLLQNLPLYK